MLSLLKTIPNDLTVKECKESDDPRIKFIITNYIKLRKSHKEMDVLSDDMTMGAIKDNLNKIKKEDLFAFIDEYRDTFVHRKEENIDTTEKTKRKVFWIIFYYILTIFTLVLGVSVTYGIISDTLSVNEIITNIFSKIVDIFSVFIPKDPAL